MANYPPDNPAQRAWSITPSDSNLVVVGVAGVPFARGIISSLACTVKVTTIGGDVVTLPLQPGFNPVSVAQVWATGTTLGSATIYGYY